MKKIIILFGVFLSFISTAQNNSISIENWCGTSQRMNLLMQDPAYQIIHQQDEEIRAYEAANPKPQQKAIYKVPIVFHILHNGGSENVSEEQIYNAFDVLNRDFRKQNEDTADVIPAFKSLIADVEIEFVLATKAPNGACFRGYTRTQSITTFSGGGNDGDNQVLAVRNGNDVYQGNWPSNKYLNVYIVADAGGAGGYTNYPNNGNFGNMENGIWLLHTQFGEIGTSSASAGRSLTHECGHWFNLPHTWGSSNTPGPGEGNCGMDDGVSDTPLCEGSAGGCPISQVTCGSLDNIQNYMDYALSCQSMFTLGQADKMRTAIQSSVGGRSNLWTPSNLDDTGANGIMELCKADFSVNKTSFCPGTQIQFTDESYNDVTGWSWTFEGGTPPTSNSQNPTVTYNSPGIYSVTLEATDGTTDDTEIKTGLIHVVPDAVSIPLLEGFESYSTLNGLEEWAIINPSGNGFELTTTGLNSTKSTRLRNFGQTSGDIDELIASPIDLSNASQVTLSFRYAHKRRNTSDGDILRLFATKDCGNSWAIRKTMLLTSSPVQVAAFTPSSESDWTTVHVINITSTYLVDNFRYKFTFEGGGGNNIYLDNINIYEGAFSDELVTGTSGVGLNEISSVKNLEIYPNPTDEELNVKFALDVAQKILLSITDLTGKKMQQNSVNGATGSNFVLIDTKELSSGVYFIEIEMNGLKEVRQFIVK